MLTLFPSTGKALRRDLFTLHPYLFFYFCFDIKIYYIASEFMLLRRWSSIIFPLLLLRKTKNYGKKYNKTNIRRLTDDQGTSKLKELHTVHS